MKKLLAPFIISLLPVLLAGCATSDSQSVNTVSEKPPPLTRQQKLVRGIEQDIAANRLTTPSDNSAMQKLEVLEEVAPSSPEITHYKNQIAKRYVTLSERALKRNDYITASTYVINAKKINADTAGLDDVMTRIQNYQQKVSPTPVPALAPPIMDVKSLEGKATLETVALPQPDIVARKFELRYHIDLVIEKTVKQNALLLLSSQSEADALWLSALVKSRIRLSHPYYNLALFVRIDAEQGPMFTLYSRTP